MPWMFGPFAFVITFAETWIASKERQHERLARTSRFRRHSILSANWGLLFEIVLLADIVMTVAEPVIIGPWVAAGAWLGQYLAVEKMRLKFRANAGNVTLLRKSTKRAKIDTTPDLGGTSAADAAVITPKTTT